MTQGTPILIGGGIGSSFLESWVRVFRCRNVLRQHVESLLPYLLPRFFYYYTNDGIRTRKMGIEPMSVLTEYPDLSTIPTDSNPFVPKREELLPKCSGGIRTPAELECVPGGPHLLISLGFPKSRGDMTMR